MHILPCLTELPTAVPNLKCQSSHAAEPLCTSGPAISSHGGQSAPSTEEWAEEPEIAASGVSEDPLQPLPGLYGRDTMIDEVDDAAEAHVMVMAVLAAHSPVSEAVHTQSLLSIYGALLWRGGEQCFEADRRLGGPVTHARCLLGLVRHKQACAAPTAWAVSSVHVLLAVSTEDCLVIATTILPPDLVQSVLSHDEVLQPPVLCMMPCHPCCSSVPLLHICGCHNYTLEQVGLWLQGKRALGWVWRDLEKCCAQSQACRSSRLQQGWLLCWQCICHSVPQFFSMKQEPYTNARRCSLRGCAGAPGTPATSRAAPPPLQAAPPPIQAASAPQSRTALPNACGGSD